MKVAGIIAEYNPFHNGHEYQLNILRQEKGVDYIIIAMSGDFVQRGTPAIIDKYKRAEMALSAGADLVVELPSIWATSSAEYFGKAGVSLFQQTGITDYLAFGAENNQISELTAIAQLLLNKELTQPLIHEKLKAGHSYPVARSLVCHQLCPDYSCEEILSSPNNILAIEYIKALSSTNIEPLLIQRKGDGYHQTDSTSPLSSASAIRKLIEQKNYQAISSLVPANSYSILLDTLQKGQYVDIESISDMLYYALLSSDKNDLLDIADCNRELVDKIYNNLSEYAGYQDFCGLLKSKELTHSRISRALLHILLKHSKQSYQMAMDQNWVPYLRLLGFKKESATLLSAIKANASIPIISKVADASKILNKDAYQIFNYDLESAMLYNQLLYNKCKIRTANDFSHELVIR